ncbi:hypothetical protein FB45DRAFT_1086315 [Roridomyces roridus]|uniref:Uncharacterized protein n=1 Tax=Roridomyces roridus TaxID=1738132 RepID=A0AAD7BLB2_9AGAR|nr:hypothetical protein FB45DRAFT_1086315 [Roridomyces roridus]
MFVGIEATQEHISINYIHQEMKVRANGGKQSAPNNVVHEERRQVSLLREDRRAIPRPRSTTHCEGRRQRTSARRRAKAKPDWSELKRTQSYAHSVGPLCGHTIEGMEGRARGSHVLFDERARRDLPWDEELFPHTETSLGGVMGDGTSAKTLQQAVASLFQGERIEEDEEVNENEESGRQSDGGNTGSGGSETGGAQERDGGELDGLDGNDGPCSDA